MTPDLHFPVRAQFLATLLLVILFGLLVAGCVPASRITLGHVSIRSPKDVTISNFRADVETNGHVTVTFDALTSTNSPAVLDAETRKQSAITRAAVEGAVGAAIKGLRP